MSNHRLVDVRDGQVHCTSRDRRQGDVVRTMARKAHACIHRFLLHVLPHGCMRIRPIGFWANRCKAHALGQCRQRLGQPPDTPKPWAKSVAEWMPQWTGMDITRCPHCGNGPLLRRSVPPLGQQNGDPLPPPIFDASYVTRRSPGSHMPMPRVVPQLRMR
jgi:hypothetical protein